MTRDWWQFHFTSDAMDWPLVLLPPPGMEKLVSTACISKLYKILYHFNQFRQGVTCDRSSESNHLDRDVTYTVYGYRLYPMAGVQVTGVGLYCMSLVCSCMSTLNGTVQPSLWFNMVVQYF